jgi:hypothetical protein
MHAVGRWRAVIVGAVALVFVSSCSLTEDRHFGVSRSSDGHLYTWFIECVSPPLGVSLYSRDDSSGRTWWAVTGDGETAYPTRFPIGAAPDGYRLRVPLRSDPPSYASLPPSDASLRLYFGSGEAWGEHVDFRPRDLPANGDVLTADGRVMSPEQFAHQSCDDGGT